MDDEIKLVGLEALVPEELEKHLILNSNRLRTFEDARLEVVTHMEAKFGLRIRSDTDLREHSEPMDVGQSNEKGHQVRAMGVLSAVEHIFNETAMQTRTPASNRLAKAIRASHGPSVSPQSQAKARVKRTVEKITGQSKGSKGSGKGKTLKTGISGLENLKTETGSETQKSVHMGQVYTTDQSWIHDEWSLDEWNDGWSLYERNDD